MYDITTAVQNQKVVTSDFSDPDKQEILNQCWLHVDPPSTTLGQH